ncbi:MAG: beta-L-arabinofuranosidase domain-containing protein [Candidatus Merdivicinus sp.]
MLQKLKKIPYTARELKPSGWLKRQLEIQAEGLSGHLDEIWPDIRDSRWIGGDQEGWERVPYWLDGFIPLAWLLDREDLKARAKRYIEAILAGQKEDGWICPCADEERGRYDVWAAFLICKVLTVYADCTGDERIEEVVYRVLKNLDSHIEKQTLFNWGQARWFECLIPLYWVYERRPERWLADLAYKLRMEGINYHALFADWRFEKPENRWSYLTHVVNLAMALKAEALFSRIGGGDANDFSKQAIGLLQRYHGMPTGHFTGDECLSGTSPLQGSELCSVVEAMYSYEHLIAITGDSFWSDLLERLAYNALPATISPDMWTHQYDQMTNQPQCSYLSAENNVFRTNSGESHLFGLEPNFGCCTANFSQGWPKFALSVLMKAEDGVAVTAIAPAVLEDQINGVPVRIEIETEYPFRDSYHVSVKAEAPVEFALYLRIPGFVSAALVEEKEAQPGEEFRIFRKWKGKKTISVSFGMEASLHRRPSGMYCLNRGPLLYSLPVGERWQREEFTHNGVERKYPYCDYQVFPTTKWNYAFSGENWEPIFSEMGEYPFSPDTASIRLKGMMTEVEWNFRNGLCEEVPNGNPISAPQWMELIPYGCTSLRMTELPLVRKNQEDSNG